MMKVKRTSTIDGTSTEYDATIIDRSADGSQYCVDWCEPTQAFRKWLPAPGWGRLSGRWCDLELVRV